MSRATLARPRLRSQWREMAEALVAENRELRERIEELEAWLELRRTA